MNKGKIFLGGTCNNSTWRDELIPLLNMDYFNPVVEDWTDECQEEERRQKEECGIHLYVITNQMKGVFSIAEAVASAHIVNKSTVFYVLSGGFDEGQLRSLKATYELIKSIGGIGDVTEDNSMEELARRLNFSYAMASSNF